MRIKPLYIVLIGLLVSCATTPDFDMTQVDRSLTPQGVIAESAPNLGKIVLWGGTILDTRNMKDTTRIEVLAYPLSASHQPLQESKALGRFVVKHQGYLEPNIYAPGRLLTVLGSVNDTQSGKVGESTYTYPVINARQLHLWSQNDLRNRTTFHFGIGIEL